ncbi:MAG: nitrous oxide-stimulated promoter family protein [Planctomycetota bacterium]|jgi:hypothetical protein
MSLKREIKTVSAMIGIFCKAHHAPARGKLCFDCIELMHYARQRLEKCPYKPNKGPCSKCTTHCYKPEYRARIIEVMRYSGPRMLTRHPILAIDHLLSSRKEQPNRSTAKDMQHKDNENS